MTQEYQLRILPEIAANEQRLKEYISKEKGINLRNITATRILKRSIDARQRTIFVNLKVRAYINEMPKEDEYERTIYNNVEGKPQVIIVGAGPGGMFAALRLIEAGYRPVIVEYAKLVALMQTDRLDRRKAAPKISQLREIRELSMKTARRVRDYMDWYEINTRTGSGKTFDSYAATMKLIREQEAPANTPIARYLDDIEKLYTLPAKAPVPPLYGND